MEEVIGREVIMFKRLSTITLVICAIAALTISQSAYAQPEGLVLWNKLGSDEEVLNSAFGPDLEFYIGGGGIEVQGDREYLPVTLKGVYFNMARVHNLVLSNLSNVIDPEKGCIELWYYHTALPEGYSYNCYRLFDGIYGLGAGMGFDLYDYYYQPKKTLRFWLSFGASGVPTLEYDANNIPVNQWVHLAASWDRDGINGSSETIRLYVNGAKVAWSTLNGWGNTVGSRADICGGNDRDIAGKFCMDNLKIWNYAKTDFSDRFAEIPVAIDIKPGSEPNSINLGSNGVFPVAILSSEDFDATQADPGTVSLAGAGVAVRGKNSKPLAHGADVNKDGRLDLVVQVETEDLDPDQLQDGLACLTGETYGGESFAGFDEIRIVPPEAKPGPSLNPRRKLVETWAGVKSKY